MATVAKDFKVKQGLIVEGTTGTINNYDILTKKTDDQNYIVNLIGGTATSANQADKVVKRDGSGNFAAGVITADLVGDVTGNADTATTLETSRKIELVGDVTGEVMFNGSQNVQITATIDGDFATDAEVATAKQQAIDAAALDATTKANAAQAAAELTASNALSSAVTTLEGQIADAEADANTYTDNAITALNLAGTYDPLGAADDAVDAHNNLTSGIHGVTGDVVGTTDTQTLSNKTLGSDLAAGGYKVSGLATPTANADAATKAYVDTVVSDLVDGAPALLDTLNELAAAIADNPNYATNIATSLGEKVAKAGDSMTGNLDFGGTNKVTSLATPTSNGDAANKLYVDTAESNAVASANSYTNIEISDLDTAAQGYASTAQSNAETFATNAANTAEANANTYTNNAITALDLANTYDALGAASTAESNANSFTTNAINALTTSDIEEGTNKYFTNARAKAEAATLLANATKTNIVITKDVNDNLTITAENGVADSNTDQLVEGSTNLYFTNARAVSALEAVTPNFPAVEIDSVAKQVASSALVGTASTNTAVSWAVADYKSAEFLVKIANGSHTEVSKVILTLDTSNNVAITEYAMVGTNGSLGSVSADVSGTDVRLRVTTSNNNSTVSVVGTLLV
jgi:hypothetical protein